MRIPTTAALLVLSFFPSSYKVNQLQAGKPATTLVQPLDGENDKTTKSTSLPGGLSLDGFFNKVADAVRAPIPNEKEQRALNEVEAFIKKYTGNGRMNYGTVPRLVEGLKYDYSAINREGQYMSGFAGMAARRYPHNLFSQAYNSVQAEVVKRGTAEIKQKLAYFDVDPSTASDIDNSPITSLVTKEKLDELHENMIVLDRMAVRHLSPNGNKRLIFPKGIGLETIDFIRERKVGFPPGGEIVEIVSVDTTKKLPGSYYVTETEHKKPLRRLTYMELGANKDAAGKTFQDTLKAIGGGAYYYLNAHDGKRYLILERASYNRKTIRNEWVQFIIQKDKKAKPKWAPLELYPKYHQAFLSGRRQIR